MTKLGLTIACAISALAATSSAHAEFLRFYSGNSSLSIDNGSARMCPVGSSPVACASGTDLRSAEDGALRYSTTSGGILTVTGQHGGSGGTGDVAIQHRSPSFGGLGVDGSPAADSIGANERLTLSFAAPVTLTDLVLFDVNHGTRYAGGTFDVFVNGSLALDNRPLTNLVSGLNLTGTSFAFATGSAQASSAQGFYVGGANIAAVPLPGTLALVGVAFAGGALARRRR